MRLFFILSLIVMLAACTSTPNETAQQDINTPLEDSLENTIEKSNEGYHFYIPSENIQDGQGVLIDTLSPVNKLVLLGGALEARLYWDADSVQYLALNQYYAKGQCLFYLAEILEMLESNEYRDVTENFFPGLSLYKFYDFGDPQVSQFEGDEQTVFSGYRFDFSKKDMLGIQFMFCNQQDAEDTRELNENGKINYISFSH